ncbi:MAG TPA: M48 family metalloprotease [Bryobacteraceae bacterium]|nr:M48 family metalloprotease [Bryobacteraceae bacterium]
MKPGAIVILAALAASPMYGQFGGFGSLRDKIQNKIDQGKQKTKAVQDEKQKAIDTFTPWSADEEQAIGSASAAKMVAMFGLVNDEKLTRYVNLVGSSVAQYASRPLPYRFAVLDTEIVGAWSLPGGYIFVTRQSLASMKNEAELAGALGHEIVHASERHLEKEIRSKKTSAWAAEQAQKNSNVQEIAKLRSDALLKDLFSSSLSRDKEDQADEMGTQLAARAGYAASGLKDFLATLKTLNDNPSNRRMFGQILSTHPPFDARIAHLEPIVQSAGSGGVTLEARFSAATAH